MYKMKGIIYKVDLGGEIYVGSTTTKLSKRQANHNSDLRKGKFTDKHKLYSKCVEKNIENIFNNIFILLNIRVNNKS